MAKVAVQIVTWESGHVIDTALESLESQTFRDFTITVIDNASRDGAVRHIQQRFPYITVLQNRRNLGFAFAHNQAIALARHLPDPPAYVLVMNPDVRLGNTYLETIVDAAENDVKAGSFTGKLLRTEDPPVLDSTGIIHSYTMRFFERGAGEADQGQYDAKPSVWGVSGALGLYRLRALESAARDHEIFDQDFFSYKEDVDLAWRLRRQGWTARYVSEAVAVHPRHLRASQGNLFKRFVGELRKPAPLKFYSFRNHGLMLLKNFSWKEALYHLPGVVLKQILEGVVLLFMRPALFFRALKDQIVLTPAMLRKRIR